MQRPRIVTTIVLLSAQTVVLFRFLSLQQRPFFVATLLQTFGSRSLEEKDIATVFPLRLDSR
jgi:hypothetical protein